MKILNEWNVKQSTAQSQNSWTGKHDMETINTRIFAQFVYFEKRLSKINLITIRRLVKILNTLAAYVFEVVTSLLRN